MARKACTYKLTNSHVRSLTCQCRIKVYSAVKITNPAHISPVWFPLTKVVSLGTKVPNKVNKNILVPLAPKEQLKGAKRMS
jgi:hypothetical protein